jgi:putative (di)nucleoside polyphosphate hydrolase
MFLLRPRSALIGAGGLCLHHRQTTPRRLIMSSRRAGGRGPKQPTAAHPPTTTPTIVTPLAQTPLAVEFAGHANREHEVPSPAPPRPRPAANAGAADATTNNGPLPYRPNVSVLLVHPRTLQVFCAKRVDDPYGTWQCPQGGIDKGERALDAALRELREETAVTSVRVIGATRGWLAYDFPPWVVEKLSKGMRKYRGQAQRWYCMLYTGADGEGGGAAEVDLSGGQHHSREFSEWAWRPLDRLPLDVSDFKRGVYAAVVEEFGPLLRELEAAGVIGGGAAEAEAEAEEALGGGGGGKK